MRSNDLCVRFKGFPVCVETKRCGEWPSVPSTSRWPSTSRRETPHRRTAWTSAHENDARTGSRPRSDSGAAQRARRCGHSRPWSRNDRHRTMSQGPAARWSFKPAPVLDTGVSVPAVKSNMLVTSSSSAWLPIGRGASPERHWMMPRSGCRRRTSRRQHLGAKSQRLIGHHGPGPPDVVDAG